MEKKTMGQFMAKLRKEKGMTQKELAEKLNVSDKSISRWERNETAPDLTLLPVIADIFGITTDELLKGERIMVDLKAVKDKLESNKEVVAENQSQKKIIYLETKFFMHSIVSLLIALAGIVGAVFFNFRGITGKSAITGFCFSFIMYLIATGYEMFVCVETFTTFSREELQNNRRKQNGKRIYNLAEVIFTIIFVLFIISLPLVLSIDSRVKGFIYFYEWFPEAMLYSIPAVVLWIVGHFNVKRFVMKKENYIIIEEEFTVLEKKWKVAKRLTIITSIIIVATWGIGILFECNFYFLMLLIGIEMAIFVMLYKFKHNIW